MLKTVSIIELGKALFIGLVVTQGIATAQVIQSNQMLLQKVRALNQAGFVAVPNALVQPMLASLQSALFGGLFFTATLGLLLIVLTIIVVIFALNLGKAKPAGLLLPWIGLLVFVNQNGFNPVGTAYGIMVPLFVGAYLLRKGVSVSVLIVIKTILLGVGGVVILTFLFTTALPENGFIRFRDRLLLNHQTGQAVNDFYYRHTLFAAETIKTNVQKQLVSYRIQNYSDATLDFGDLERSLVQYDYLHLDQQNDDTSVDLKIIVLPNQDVVIEDRYGSTFKTTLTEITATPQYVLTQFSKMSDRNEGLRQVTLFGLLGGLPLSVYGALFCVGLGLFNWRQRPGIAAAGATAICLIAGGYLWWLLWIPGPMQVAEDEYGGLLQKGNRVEKLAALEILRKQRVDITGFSSYQDLLNSPDVAIRYKVAQCLGYHDSSKNRKDIEQLLKDPSPNVRCMAVQAFGRLGDLDDIQLMLRMVAASDHWYVQYYVYKSLRRLGWIQPHKVEAL